MKRGLLILFFLLISAQTEAIAQVVDMRAYSRQHGFTAYRAKASQPAVRRDTRGTAPSRPKAPSANDAASAERETEGTSVSAFSAPEQMPVGQRREAPRELDAKKQAVNQTDEMRQYIANNPQVLPDL